MLHLAAKALLGPVLYTQARKVRATALELPEPPGERSGITGAGEPALRLLIAGDSSAAGVGAPSQDEALAKPLARRLAERLGAPVRWQLVAQTGARSEDVLELLTRSTVQAADVGLLIVGVNDMTKAVPLRTAIEWRARIAAWMQAHAGVRQVLMPALPDMQLFPALPQPLAWYAGRHAHLNNVTQERWARGQPHVSHVAMDNILHPALMAIDGFHPAPSLYASVAAHLAQVIADDLLPALASGEPFRQNRETA